MVLMVLKWSSFSLRLFHYRYGGALIIGCRRSRCLLIEKHYFGQNDLVLAADVTCGTIVCFIGD